GSKEEVERLKRKGLNLEQEKEKKQKTSEEVPDKEKSPEEKVKEMMHLVPIEEVYVQALQVKHPIINWKVYIEGQRSYWQIIRLGGSSTCYQFFVDLLKHLDREDLNQLWVLVKEYLSIRPASSNKEIELWVELKRLYEQDPEDQVWAQTQNYMHAPIEWKLYDLSGVHHVTAKDKEIFMLVEQDYPMRKGLALVMICYKLQDENYSQIAEDLIRKIYNIANSPRQQGAVDPTLCTRQAGNELGLVQIYVDDIIFASTNTAMCNEFANQMTTKFKMSMMRQMSFF
nr:copia protein [Tanacetum cinerariifolium]